MNRILKYTLLFLILISVSCSKKMSHKTYLANYIDSLKTKHSLTKNPLLIIDGTPAHYETMDDGWFLIKKEDISSLKYIQKGETEIYESMDEYGVVLLRTVSDERQRSKKQIDKKILYVLDGKIISFEEYKKIDQTKIIGIGTITEQSAIKEFTSGNYDELIYVSTKMPSE